MLTAVEAMSASVQAICFGVAVVLFTIEAVLRRSLLAAGLAAFALPFFWNALAAS